MEDSHRDFIEAFTEMATHLSADTLFEEFVAQSLAKNTRVRCCVVYEGYIGRFLLTALIKSDDREKCIDGVMYLSARAGAKLVIRKSVVRFRVCCTSCYKETFE